jgi:hypothetical protein
MLDLSHIMMSDHDILRFARKREAQLVARTRGWNACDVMQAFNRFQIFWVVGERLNDGIRLATRLTTATPGWTLVPYRSLDNGRGN